MEIGEEGIEVLPDNLPQGLFDAGGRYHLQTLHSQPLFNETAYIIIVINYEDSHNASGSLQSADRGAERRVSVRRPPCLNQRLRARGLAN